MWQMVECATNPRWVFHTEGRMVIDNIKKTVLLAFAALAAGAGAGTRLPLQRKRRHCRRHPAVGADGNQVGIRSV